MATNPKMKEKFGKFFKRNPKMQKSRPTPEVPTFKQNLQACRFVEAGQQLITREDRLFVLKQEGIGTKKKLLEEEEDSEAKLAKDYEDWLESVRRMLENSLSLKCTDEQEALREAVQAILQDEEQDKRWEVFDKKEQPPWRPRHCKKYHDALLERLVQSRMEETQLDSSVNLHSSVQNYIISKGKQLKEDLLKVMTWVSSCYPEQENVCQFYAMLYHQTFSAKLRGIAQYGLCDDDCFLLLHWVNYHYPSILNDVKIKEVIDHTKLDLLLPEEMIRPLERQFLTSKENEVSTWLHRALTREETSWKEGAFPEIRNQMYTCPLAIDVIECIHGSVTSAQEVLGDGTKAWSITCEMSNFLKEYKSFNDKVIKAKQKNTEAVLMANLSCITHFREYILKNADLVPESIKTDCLSLLTTMREGSHHYLTAYVHKDLKELYRRLGSNNWLKDSEGICEELLAKFGRHIQKFHNLDRKSCQELLGRLHKEFLAEYVRRMMKQKIRLADKEKQQKAAARLCKDSESIHACMTAAGSSMDWLKDILPQLAGLLKLQDPDSIKLELVNLLREYPDFSEHHISAWLRLKANLSASDLKRILKSIACSQDKLNEEQDLLQLSKSFFSTVRI
ncbi:tumor necrosis factor alpha-induced protein 2 [Xyrauchen texanus]|uniref:tumor necrosis factor alpha-induced protein 2 n=1 Tax=Xyrauchen texanus TaxID=154827 RepID=UPI0022424DBF|nr:tumor necrosis factor alpha-induced protein 2 [Xyrauchen texanus]